MKRLLTTLCAAALLGLCLAGCGDDPDIISDAELVMSRVRDIAEDFTASGLPAAGGMAEGAPSDAEPQTAEESVPATAANSGPEQTGGLRPGRYEGPDGAVLSVSEDGTCTYETTVSGTVDGEEMSGTVTFHGAVYGGDITFARITYYGLDITALAAAAGYDDFSYWETAAESIYGG